jgi:hypothetical protein
MPKEFDTVEGKICFKSPVETFGNKGFRKQTIVVETDGKYPQTIPVEVSGDLLVVSNGLQFGEQVKVSYWLRGNKYKERYYVNLSAKEIVRSGNKELDYGNDKTKHTISNSEKQMQDKYADCHNYENEEIPF